MTKLSKQDKMCIFRAFAVSMGWCAGESCESLAGPSIIHKPLTIMKDHLWFKTTLAFPVGGGVKT